MTTCSPSSRGRSGPAGCPQTLAGLLERRQHDPRAALIEGAIGRSVTWADVAGAAAALRARRPELTTDPQRPLGLHLSDPVMMASSFVGALVAGIGAAPLNPAATPAELVSRCRAVGTAVVVTDSPDARFVDAFTSGVGHRHQLEGARPRQQRRADCRRRRAPRRRRRPPPCRGGTRTGVAARATLVPLRLRAPFASGRGCARAGELRDHRQAQDHPPERAAADRRGRWCRPPP